MPRCSKWIVYTRLSSVRCADTNAWEMIIIAPMKTCDLDPQQPAFQAYIRQQVANALAEDIGLIDFSAQLIAPQQQACASILARESGLICGIPWCNQVFQQCAATIQLDWQCEEGQAIHADQTLVIIRGPAQALLSAERTALNFLQTLSAVATITQRYVKLLQGSACDIMDTRKTLPGLRLAQKYAVKVGGGRNQRLGLYDGILIKENHIHAAGSIAKALAAAEKLASQNQLPVQIEVENVAQLEQALEAGARLILLDNFPISLLKQAVQINQQRAILEASGGVTLSTVRAIADTGVDRISSGDLTKNIQAMDLSMRFDRL